MESDLSAGSLRFNRTFNHINTDTASLAVILGVNPREVLGSGWSHNYQQRIRVQDDKAWAIRGDGNAFKYQRNGSGAWRSDADITDTLVELTDAQGGRAGWRFIDIASGRVETYDAAGRLQTLAQSGGRLESLVYSDGNAGGESGGVYLDASGAATGSALPAGLLRYALDESGRYLRFDYDLSGRIVRVGDGSRSVAYRYDSADNLSTVSYPDQGSKTYLYGERDNIAGLEPQPHALTGIVDENGLRNIDYYYDASGHAIAEKQPGDINKTDLAYTVDAVGNITRTVVKDALGASRTYDFTNILGANYLTGISQPGGSGCSAASSKIGYDANGNVSTRSDFVGNQQCYAYDTSRNLETVRLDGLSSSTTCPADLASYALPAPAAADNVKLTKTTTQWHPTWRLKARVAEPRLITTWVYNGQPDPTDAGKLLRCAPDGAYAYGSEPIAVLCKKVEQATTDATGTLGFGATAEGSPRIWRYSYNARGQLLSEDGPRTDIADITTYTYYNDLSFDANGDGHGVGDLETVTNAVGQLSAFTRYDRAGHLRRRQDANGTVSQYSYHPRGWLLSERVNQGSTDLLTLYDYDALGQLIHVMLPNQSEIFYTYDVAHRLTDISDGLGNSIHYTLDKGGNRIKEEVSDANGVLQRLTTRIFDQLGRLQNVVYDGSVGSGAPQYLDYDTTTQWNPAPAALSDLNEATVLSVQVNRQPLPGKADSRFAAWGKLRLLDGGSPLADLDLDASGKARYTWTPTITGNHTLTARYLGTPYSGASETMATVKVVSRVATKIALVASPSETVGVNALITLSATVVDANGNRLACDPNIPCAKSSVATSTYGYGKVRFYDGDMPIGEVELSEGASYSVAPNAASLKWALRTTGTHTLRAEYLGTAISKAIQSGGLRINVVDAVATETRILNTTMTPAFYATQVLTLNVSINGQGMSGLPCDQTQKSCPELGYGKLQLLDNGIVVATREVFRDFAQRFEWSTSVTGRHVLTVQYLGTSAAQPSITSMTVDVKPPLATTTTVATTTSAYVVGKTTALIVDIAPEANAWLPCFTAPPCYGQVRLKDGEVVVGQADVQVYSYASPSHSTGSATGGGGGGVGYVAYTPPPPWPDPNAIWTSLGLAGDVAGNQYLRARVLWTPTSSGPHTLTAEYLGGGGLSPSTAARVSLTVSPPLETNMTFRQWGDITESYGKYSTTYQGFIEIKPDAVLGQAVALRIKLINPALYSLACDGTLGGCPASGYGSVSLLDNGIEIAKLLVSRSPDGGDKRAGDSNKPYAYEATAIYTWIPKTSGTHVLTASFPGTTPNQPVSQSATVVVGDAIGTSTSWATTPAASLNLGATSKLTAQISASDGKALMCDPSRGACPNAGFGKIRFTDNGVSLGEANVNAQGQASFTWAPTTAGPHQLQASYLGTSTYTPSQTDAASSSVTGGAIVTVTTWLNAPAATLIVGNSVYLRAKVAPQAGGALSCGSTSCPAGSYGTLRFLDGSTVIADAQVGADGSANASWVPATVGTHTVTAQYTGSSQNLASDTRATVSVSKATTTMSWLTSIPGARTVGAEIPLSVQLGPKVAGNLLCDPQLNCNAQSYGTVKFYDGANLLEEVPVGADGKVVYVWTPTTQGPRTVSAQYQGTSVLTSSALNASTNIVVGTPVNIDWHLAGLSYRALRTENLVWTVVPANGAKFEADANGSYGVIEVYDADGKQIGTATVGSDGKASLAWKPKLGGDQTLTARYLGTGVNQPARYEQLIFVEWIPTRVVWLQPNSPDQILERKEQIIKVRIEPLDGTPLQPCEGTLACQAYPRGQVLVTYYTPTLSWNLDLRDVNVATDGTASFTWTPPEAGVWKLKASYHYSGANHNSDETITVQVK